MQKTLKIECEDENYRYILTDERPFAIGEKVALIEHYNENTGKSTYTIRRSYTPKYNESFQGSWSNISTFFLGYMTVVKASEVYEGSDNRKDEYKGGYFQKVTVKEI